MNILERMKLNKIEGMSTNKLKDILINNSFDCVVFDTILINSDKRISCIKNYYCKNNMPNVKTHKKCNQIQKHFEISNNVKPYYCVDCHLAAIELKEANMITINNNK